MSFFFSTGGGAGGLSETTQTLSNNQSNTNLTGLNFDSSSVKRAEIQMSYNRTMNDSSVKQVGIILVMLYNGSSWDLYDDGAIDGPHDESGVTFDNNAGQVRYSSSNEASNGTGEFAWYVREFSA